MKPTNVLILGLLCAAAVSGCKREEETSPPEPKAEAAPAPAPETSPAAPAPPATEPAKAETPGASAQIKPASGSDVSGIVDFFDTGEGVRMAVAVRGLTAGKHGIHIHKVGDCTAADAASAGDHFNPGNQTHGAPDAEMRHGGDLGNIEAGANGRGQLTLAVKGLSITGANSIVGKSILIHAAEDDLKSQPAGNSGARIACGVIREAA